tara:strand:+ start:498 stop:1403 length:906 start_codon:yes stop_codon:yes gene_type:complete
MTEKSSTAIEFENSEEDDSTDINPQEINKDPAAYARKIASDRGDSYDQMAGFSVPRDFVMLPSKGRVYSSDSALHNMEELEVRHLTAADEDIMTSRALLRSGKAIDTMLSNVIINKSINVEQLVSGDKNAILTFLRITGYGPEYPVDLECPNCDEQVSYDFDLSQLKMKFLDNDPVSEGQNRFGFELPSGVNIEFKLLNSAEDAAITAEQEKYKKVTKSPLEKTVTTRLKHQIVSIDGKDNKSLINNFVDNMNVRDSRAFRKYLEDLEPDVIMKQDFVCPMCSHTEEVDIPVTVGFFWPND